MDRLAVERGASAAHRGSYDPRVVSDVVHVAGKQGRDGRRSGNLNQLRIKSLSAEKAAFAGREQWKLLKGDGWKADANALFLGGNPRRGEDSKNKI